MAIALANVCFRGTSGRGADVAYSVFYEYTARRRQLTTACFFFFLLFPGLARADAMHRRPARRIAGRKALVGIDHDLILVVLYPLALVFRVLLRFFRHKELRIRFCSQ